MTEIACDLSVFTGTERADYERESNAVLGSLVRDAYELEDGLELHYGDAAGVTERVQAWIASERRCCPFFHFSLRVEQPGGITLRVTGAPPAKQILLEEIRSRGGHVHVGPPPGAAPEALLPKGSPLKRAGWVAGGGALLCMIACAAPMLLAGGMLGTAGLVVAGYAETAGLALVVIGFVIGAIALVRRARRQPAASPRSGPSCGC